MAIITKKEYDKIKELKKLYCGQDSNENNAKNIKRYEGFSVKQKHDLIITLFGNIDSKEYKTPDAESTAKTIITNMLSTITDADLEACTIIDDEYLRNTIYIESMEKFNYSPKRVDISNGHILLTYGIGAGDGWNFPHLVFEYDFDSNKLEYKLLAFPFDSVPIEIIYIG